MPTPEVLSSVDITRAVKEEDYRNTLNDDQKLALAQLIEQGELSDDLLEEVAGGAVTIICPTWMCNER
jgi:hypothetical protein